MSNSRTLAVFAGAVLLALLLLWMQGRRMEKESRFEADAIRAEAFARAQKQRADSAVMAANLADAQAKAALAMADSLRNRRPRLVLRVDTVPVPVDALPYTAPRDSLIAELSQENDALRVVIAEQRTVADNLRMSNELLSSAADSLRAVLGRRPKPRPRWLPTLGVGAVAGYCKDGTAGLCGGGLTLSWELKI